MLLTRVNLAYYQSLMRGAREAIAAGTFADFRAAKKRGWDAGDIPPR
jgi:queuine tRNA-ribosyltransferase